MQVRGLINKVATDLRIPKPKVEEKNIFKLRKFIIYYKIRYKH